MKIQILWNIKDGTYPHFMKARPEMNDNPVYKGKVFPLNKEIVLLMKEKKCKYFSIQQGTSGGGFLTDEEHDELLKISKKIIAFVREDKGDLEKILEEIDELRILMPPDEEMPDEEMPDVNNSDNEMLSQEEIEMLLSGKTQQGTEEEV